MNRVVILGAQESGVGAARLAQQRAYERLAGIVFDGAQWRRDIGHRAIRPR